MSQILSSQIDAAVTKRYEAIIKKILYQGILQSYSQMMASECDASGFNHSGRTFSMVRSKDYMYLYLHSHMPAP